VLAEPRVPEQLSQHESDFGENMDHASRSADHRHWVRGYEFKYR